MKYFILSFYISLLLTSKTSVAEDTIDLKKAYIPIIQENTLYITGRIDSHIYDYLSYQYNSIKKIKFVSLNSYGGNVDWALSISEKLKQLSLNTIVEKGNVCASACLYLFSSGKERILSEDTWLGLHGARIGMSYAILFEQNCKNYTHSKENTKSIDPSCQTYIMDWYNKILALTLKSFSFMEENGVSMSLRTDYFSLNDDPFWYKQLNVLRKPDCILSPKKALEYNLATKIFTQLTNTYSQSEMCQSYEI